MRFAINKRPNVKPVALSCLLFVLFFQSCSVEKNTLSSKAYHNLASHYNGFFYAKEELTKIEQSYFKSMKDDYNRVLRLYPKLDSTKSKEYEKELKEIVKMASLAIQRHANSKWVDDSYILVGKARMYSLDWGNAIQTFKYVNTTSKDVDARHESILALIRTFIEHREFNNAQVAIDFLEKEKLDPSNLKELYLQKAYLAQTLNDLDKMVQSLTAAVPLLKKKEDRPGRIYFIIGETYQKLGFEAEAYNYYKRCLTTHPEYEVDFYARLFMAQVTEISKTRNITSARKSFKKLLKDAKNRDFKDKIYYEMGLFEVKQQHIEEGIDNFNLAIRLGSNKRIDGEAYLQIGQLQYELKNYELSQSYYDSALKSLPKDFENIEQIKKRHDVLNDFVKNLQTIRWQDSLLTLSTLDSTSLRLKVEAIVKAQETKTAVEKKKKRLNRIEINENTPSVFASEENTEAQENGGAWYFANSNSISLGQTEFIRTWGTIALEDNWRRSQRSIARTDARPTNATPSISTIETKENSISINPIQDVLSKIKAELPDTKEKKMTANQKIEEAYFALGDLYSLQLQEPENAIDIYVKLITSYPLSNYMPEVLYRLHILTKALDPTKSSLYAANLMDKYPESSWTKILVNPNYLTEAGKVVIRQKALYGIAFEKYKQEKYDSANLFLQKAIDLGNTSFTPNLSLLNILNNAKTSNLEEYKTNLTSFIQLYSSHELKPFAERLLQATTTLSEKKEAKSLFSTSSSATYSFAIAITKTPEVEKVVIEALQKFNKDAFQNINFNITTELLEKEKLVILVKQFSDKPSAMEYLLSFNEKLATLTLLKNYNFNNFVISENNLETLKRTQALNEYLIFYTRNFQTENQ